MQRTYTTREARTTGGNLHPRTIKINVPIGVDRYSPTKRQLRRSVNVLSRDTSQATTPNLSINIWTSERSSAVKIIIDYQQERRRGRERESTVMNTPRSHRSHLTVNLSHFDRSETASVRVTSCVNRRHDNGERRRKEICLAVCGDQPKKKRDEKQTLTFSELKQPWTFE